MHCLSLSPPKFIQENTHWQTVQMSQKWNRKNTSIKLCTSLLSNSYPSKSNTLNSSLAWRWYNHTPLFLRPLFSVNRLKNNYYPHYTNFQVVKMYLTHYFRNCCPLPHWILSMSTISIMSDRPPLLSLSPPY